MPTTLQLVAVQLRVPNLQRSMEFYVGQLGFTSVGAALGQADLGVAPDAAPILRLLESPAAVVPARECAGLFHAALLLPSRPALGAWLAYAAERKVEFDGFSDHGVSEAIYLSDPDGNGLEFYADRPRDVWPFKGGELAMTTVALDVRQLLADAAPVATSPLQGAHWGHLHLRVTDLERSDAFYRSALGVNVTQGSYPGARFLAADGYHHHVALNTWSRPRLPQPSQALGLAEATFARVGVPATTELTDPDGIRLRVIPGAAELTCS
jgi:catechol 2,3-dioxygenase